MKENQNIFIKKKRRWGTYRIRFLGEFWCIIVFVCVEGGSFLEEEEDHEWYESGMVYFCVRIDVILCKKIKIKIKQIRVLLRWKKVCVYEC